MRRTTWAWAVVLGLSACKDAAPKDDDSDECEACGTDFLPHDTDDVADTDVVDTDVVDTEVPDDTSLPDWDLPDTGLGDTDPGTIVPCDTDLGADLTARRGPVCYLYFEAGRTHEGAVDQCDGLGGELLVIGDATEDDFVTTRFSGSDQWLGITDTAEEGTFTEPDGDIPTYLHWNGGEPNDSSGEDCAVRFTWGSWNDLSCNDDGPSVVCEVTTCGDEHLDAFEECDDGNEVDGDGCDEGCRITACGNGVLTDGEACDDGNEVDGDGCEHDCTFACGGDVGQVRAWLHGGTCLVQLPGTADWRTSESLCERIGAHLPTVLDVADAERLREVRRRMSGPIGLEVEVDTGDTGDGLSEAWVTGEEVGFERWDLEQPDGPGCAWTVEESSWWEVVDCEDDVAGVVCELVDGTCGDGSVDGTEACDDGNAVTEACPPGERSCTVCDARCASVPGAVSGCHDGRLDDREGCDDANHDPDDGCAQCVADPAFTCVGEPSSCGRDAVVAGPGLGVGIPDDDYDGSLMGMACVDLPSTAGGNVTQLAVQLAVEHSYVGDLTAKVVSPSGTVATLFSRPGLHESADDGSEDGPASRGNEQAYLDLAFPLTFSDVARKPAESIGEDVTWRQAACRDDGVCSFRPSPDSATDEGFAEFVGEPKAGTWRVCVGDGEDQDDGTIDAVRIVFE